MEKELERLKIEIEKHLGWGVVSEWHSSMFNELSEKIFEATNVNLSIATLKRFFGVVKHEGTPSITTLDALSQFLKYENWRDFKLKSVKITSPKFRLPNKKGVYISLGFVLCFAIISLIANRRPEVVVNSSEFTFSSQVKSMEYPNTVVFNFSLPDNLKSDSLVIQQSWDPTKTVEIRRDQNTATGIYYQPGYFRAKLLVEGQIVKEHDLFLKSNGWLGTLDYAPIPKYFRPELKGKVMMAPKEIEEEVQASEEMLVTTYQYVDDFGDVSDDNFTFSAQVENHSDEIWAVCKMMSLYFLGSEGALIVPFSKIGCSSEVDIMLNDVYLDGKENDLSALSSDFTGATDIKVSVNQKKLTVSISGKEVYTQSYNMSIGKLVGLRFRFLGTGQINEFHLFDKNQEEISLD